MSLDSGNFTIFNQGSLASRNRYEDHSLNPKGIFCPADAGVPGEWASEKLENGRYILRCRGAPTGVEGDRVVAFINNEDKVVEWNITRQEEQGLYLIEGPNRLVWWAPHKEDGYHQVTVRPLLPGPQAPPQALWRFERA